MKSDVIPGIPEYVRIATLLLEDSRGVQWWPTLTEVDMAGPWSLEQSIVLRSMAPAFHSRALVSPTGSALQPWCRSVRVDVTNQKSILEVACGWRWTGFVLRRYLSTDSDTANIQHHPGLPMPEGDIAPILLLQIISSQESFSNRSFLEA